MSMLPCRCECCRLHAQLMDKQLAHEATLASLPVEPTALASGEGADFGNDGGDALVALPNATAAPERSEAETAIDSALSDALNAVKVLYTMLRKTNLQGYAVADEVAASIVYAPKMRAALSARPAVEGAQVGEPIKMILHCPQCRLQHIDAPDDRTPDWKNEPHRSHLCHGCGFIWRPADVATEGVAAIETKGKADSPPPATGSGGEAVAVLDAIGEIRELMAVMHGDGGHYLDEYGLAKSIRDAQTKYNGIQQRLAMIPATGSDDTKRLNWLALNPRGAQIVVDGETKDCIFWGVSSAPEHTLREAIDAAMKAPPAPARRE